MWKTRGSLNNKRLIAGAPRCGLNLEAYNMTHIMTQPERSPVPNGGCMGKLSANEPQFDLRGLIDSFLSDPHLPNGEDRSFSILR